MEEKFEPERYSVIREKNKREIVMLRGSGCKWKRCAFCDYHFDASQDEEANFRLNEQELNKVTGLYHKLEVINSGSFCDLDERTIEKIIAVCKEKEIGEIHFECHWIHRREAADFRKRFADQGMIVKIKTGIETFDQHMRQDVMKKGLPENDPEVIAQYFDEACFLFGLSGQTEASMRYDIETGLAHFERICLNVMVENTTSIKPDPDVIKVFRERIYPDYIENERVDILMENTDFGVGGEKHV
ncbi:radical SAM protein [Coprococcus sp. AF21-14LB]|uniref:radical SAM protein n=1 Tax=Coprococcus sp. AF21-14LB TaxID=2292231 RepID=UPI000E47F3C5|nr:radical SAM protein [Coprococcus sp. AF21-14LB]RGS80033.1 radical SAM protein [Coprococcus sp. AF21-14LB]